MFEAAPLWAKSSVKGGQYLTGRLGGMKILVMENRERKSDNDPSHHLFFTEAPDRRQGDQQAAQERGDGQRATETPRTPQTPPQAQRRGFQGQRAPDHQAPLDHDDAPE